MASNNKRAERTNKPKLSIKDKQAAKKAKQAGKAPAIVLPKPKG